MISSQDIRSVTFDKTMRGYRTEDVDAFLQQIASDMDQMNNEKAETEQKLYILAQKIEEYRKDEDNLKTALLNAQRMGENVIKEAKQKAESILRDASIKAEDITRAAIEQKQDEELELERIKAEVASFKNNVLNLYKQHIESLTTLPGEEVQEDEAQEQEKKVEDLSEQPVAELEESVEQPAEQISSEEAKTSSEDEETPGTDSDDIFDAFPDAVNLFDDNKDEKSEVFIEQPEEPTIELEQPKAPVDNAFSGFQGIKFSD